MGILNVTRIKTLREQKHWDQQDLARNAQVARSVISRLERGLQDDFKLSVITSIAHALGVTVDSLLDDTQQAIKPVFSPKLQATLIDLSKQANTVQNHVAAIIQGYLTALKNDEV